MTTFIATDASFSNPCYDGNLYTYITTKGLKKEAFAVNSQKIIKQLAQK